MKTTLSVSIESDLSDALRAEAERQRRPLSWVVAETLRAGLKHPAKRERKGTIATVDEAVRS